MKHRKNSGKLSGKPILKNRNILESPKNAKKFRKKVTAKLEKTLKNNGKLGSLGKLEEK